MGAAQVLKQNQAERLPEELARLRVVQGPNYGTVFVFTQPTVLLGRGEGNDVVIADLKASRVHAQFKLENNHWIVRDQGSQNGIGYHGQELREITLKDQDYLTVGESMFEFISSHKSSVLLLAPPRDPALIRLQDEEFAKQRERVRALGRPQGLSTVRSGDSPVARPAPRRDQSTSPLLKIILLGGALAYFGMDYLVPNRVSTKKPVTARQDQTAGPKDNSVPGQSSKSAEMFFKAGFREYREKNYLRAKLNFENVLQISPNHQMAKLYLENCEREIKDEVQFHLTQGKKAYDAGKLRSARGHYEALMRLLYRTPTDPRYVEAKEQLEHVNTELEAALQ